MNSLNEVKEKMNEATAYMEADKVEEFLPIYDELGQLMSNSTQVFSNTFSTVTIMSNCKMAYLKSRLASFVGVIGTFLGILYLNNFLAGPWPALMVGINLIIGLFLAHYLYAKGHEYWEVIKSYSVINRQENELIHNLSFHIQVASILKPFVMYVESTVLPEWEKRGIYTPPKQEYSPMEKLFMNYAPTEDEPEPTKVEEDNTED
jgi:hypothetical protein